MSLNKLTSQTGVNSFFNSRLNSLIVNNGIDLKGSEIKNVSLINGIPFTGVAIKPESLVIYKPGSGSHVPLTNIYGSWSEIKNVINATNGAVIIFIDDSLAQAVIDSDTDFQNRCTIRSSAVVIKPQVLINDGVILYNLSSIESIYLVGKFTNNVPLQYTNGNVLTLRGDARLSFTTTSSKPFITLSVNTFFALFMDISSTIDNSLSSSTPIIQIFGVSSLVIITLNGSAVQNNTIYGANTSGCLLITDASGSIPSLPNMLGAFNTVLEDNSLLVAYNDTAPLIGSNNVQGALDLVKLSANIKYDDTLLPQYGSTNVQGALDKLKDLTTNQYAVVGYNAAYIVTVNGLNTNITNVPYSTIDICSGLIPDGYGILIPNGTYRINWNVSFSKNVNDDALIGVIFTDPTFVITTISGIQSYNNSLANVFSVSSGETYLTNLAGNGYVQLYAISLAGNIDFTISNWNISVQKV